MLKLLFLQFVLFLVLFCLKHRSDHSHDEFSTRLRLAIIFFVG